MLQSHIILELLFANSFSNWVESRKNSSTAFGKCVQNPIFTFISILLQRRFFCLLKKQSAMPGWCSIIFVLVLFLSYLKERNKKNLKRTLQKNSSMKKGQTFLLVLTNLLSCSHLSSHHFWVKQSSFFTYCKWIHSK